MPAGPDASRPRAARTAQANDESRNVPSGIGGGARRLDSRRRRTTS